MKKVKKRALFALLPVGAALLGLCIYIVILALNGSNWASARFNPAVYRSGVMALGTLTDREGVVLAGIDEDGARTFADNADVRKATLHAVGERQGNIGTGALTVYSSELIGYDFATGIYSIDGTGNTVALTIDSRLNVEALKALDGRSGTVMVMNYKTGEVICMVSSPTFDPQNPPSDVENNPSYEGVYLNRAISSAFTPGSVFKLCTAAAAIERVPYVFVREFECSGALEATEGEITCSRAHGKIDFEEALTVSCNSAFGELALELGPETLADYTERYGLSERTTVGGILTARGNFDKARKGTANLAWSGIGQYKNTVCPAAMLRFVAAVANDGVAVDMKLIKSGGLSSIMPGGSQRIMLSGTAAALGDMMEYSVHQPQNVVDTFPGLELHAKTGTAEVGGGRRPNAWFAGYITNENYPLAFVVVVEDGGGGFVVASPIANRVLQAALRFE